MNIRAWMLIEFFSFSHPAHVYSFGEVSFDVENWEKPSPRPRWLPVTVDVPIVINLTFLQPIVFVRLQRAFFWQTELHSFLTVMTANVKFQKLLQQSFLASKSSCSPCCSAGSSFTLHYTVVFVSLVEWLPSKDGLSNVFTFLCQFDCTTCACALPFVSLFRHKKFFCVESFNIDRVRVVAE